MIQAKGILVGKDEQNRRVLPLSNNGALRCVLKPEGGLFEGLNQYKTEGHCHTFMSDGQAGYGRLIEEYYRRDYSIISFTDHDTNLGGSELTGAERLWNTSMNWTDWTPDLIDPLTPERAQEISAGVGRDGQGMIGIFGSVERSGHNHMNTYLTTYDFDSSSPNNTVEASLRNVHQQNGVANLCHISRYLGQSYFAAGFNNVNNPTNIVLHSGRIMSTPRCVGMEIINNQDNRGDSGSDRILWDQMLKHCLPLGRTVVARSNQDYHGAAMPQDRTMDASYDMFLMPELTVEAWVNAMLTGMCYAVARASRRELGTASLAPIGTHDIRINDIIVSQYGMVYRVSAMHHDRVEWISEGRIIASGERLDLRQHPEVGIYIRAQVFGPGGIAYTQALVTGNPRKTTPVDPAQTTVDGVVVNTSHYFTNTESVNEVVVNSVTVMGNRTNDAFVANNGAGVIQQADVRHGTLSNDALVHSATVRENGFLVNHTGRTVNAVAIDGAVACALVSNHGGTIHNVTMTGGTLHNTHDATGIVGSVGTATVGGNAWLYNSLGGQVTGNVSVSDTGIFENANNRADRPTPKVTVTDDGVVYNCGENSTITELELSQNGTINNGGRIETLRYTGGSYHNNVSEKYVGQGYGSIGTLVLVGFANIEETGINWGLVDSVVIGG